jgi:UDP-N-acetylglucosamine--N-acetylmuramyl-(pentapeptide) pyrophosphoryl-undecaprenol N-acetylglucosamine transferase
LSGKHLFDVALRCRVNESAMGAGLKQNLNGDAGGVAVPLKLCLAASGGGHIRQLLDLEPVWSRYPHFFVTEHSAIGDGLSSAHQVYFVDHFAVGQARLGRPFKMLAGAWRNFWQALQLVWRERPDIVISTGAGAVFWTCFFARLFGARFVLIESFARFDHPSKFASMARFIANAMVVQSPRLKARWPHAMLFDPLRIGAGARPEKQSLALSTVGATLPFDRLTSGVLALKASGALPEQLVIQTGIESAAKSSDDKSIRVVETLAFDEMKQLLRDADIVFCHSGTGSLVTALREGCRVVVMPRRFDLGEHYDDHQFEIAEAFAQRGLVELALEATDLPGAIARARTKMPVMATTDHSALCAWLAGYIQKLEGA